MLAGPVRRSNVATIALSMSACGPSRRIAPPRTISRERGIAEIDRPTSIAEGDAAAMPP